MAEHHAPLPDQTFTAPLGEPLVKPEPSTEPLELQLGRVGALGDVSLDKAVIDPFRVEAFIRPERLTKAKIEALRSTFDHIRSKKEPLSDEFARELLDIARLANLEAITEQPDSDKVVQLLEELAPYMHGPAVFGEVAPGMGGETNTKDNSVTFNPDGVYEAGYPDLAKKGFVFKHPVDVVFLKFMRVATHEDGHVMGNGISMRLAGANSFLAMTRYHLSKHPEQAVTGNWLADFRTHEERYADGVGSMGLAKIMQMLGYDQEQIRAYLKHSTLKFDVKSKRNDNQLDHLHKVNAEKGAHEFVSPNSSRRQKTAESLGYTKPLSPNEVLEVLETAADHIEQLNFGVDVPDPESWFALTQSTQKEPSLLAHLQQLKKERTRARRIDSFLGGVLMTMAALGGSSMIAGDKPLPPPVPQEMSVYGVGNPDIGKLLKDGYVLRKKMIDLDNPEQPEGKFTLTGQKDEYGRPIADVHIYYSSKANKENNSR